MMAELDMEICAEFVPKIETSCNNLIVVYEFAASDFAMLKNSIS